MLEFEHIGNITVLLITAGSVCIAVALLAGRFISTGKGQKKPTSNPSNRK